MPQSSIIDLYRPVWLFAVVALCTLPTLIHANAKGYSESPSRGPSTTSAARQEAAGTSHIAPNTAPINSIVALDNHRYDLQTQKGLDAFIEAVKGLRALSEEERSDKKSDKKEEKKDAGKEKVRKANAAAEAESAPKKKTSGKDWSAKPVRTGLKAVEHIADGIRKGHMNASAGIRQIQEICWAVESNFVTPYFWHPNMEITDLLFRARGLTLNGSGRGNKNDPALNLLTYDAADLSRVNPVPSDYWSPPSSIERKDLYHGFDREAMPDFSDAICTYDSPHNGSGVHPSFEVVQHDKRWKVKFGEERSSGPFAARIFSALGYPVALCDYTPEVKVRWDRRILTRFNSRQTNAMRVKLLGIPITNVHINPYFDPFDFIKYAVLKNGSRVEPKALREQLFPSLPGQSRPKHPELKPSVYNTAFEDTIDYLVMKDASYTSKEKGDSQEIGAWDYNYLDHPKLRELRGMAALDAWLDNWDVRWGNNQLSLIEEADGSYRLEHTVKDLGALFGNSSGLFRMVHGKWKLNLYQNAPNDYGWTFTHHQAPGKMTVPIRDYMPNSKVRPFYEMNMDDARWMARMIAQLSENQIKQALIGAGYDAPTARYLLEKLVSRRDEMIKNFGLSEEIALLRPQGVNTRLSYDPETEGPFEATLPSGETCAARNDGEFVVINGELKPAAHEGHGVQTHNPRRSLTGLRK